jgi:hypothetical protein
MDLEPSDGIKVFGEMLIDEFTRALKVGRELEGNLLGIESANPGTRIGTLFCW